MALAYRPVRSCQTTLCRVDGYRIRHCFAFLARVLWVRVLTGSGFVCCETRDSAYLCIFSFFHNITNEEEVNFMLHINRYKSLKRV